MKKAIELLRHALDNIDAYMSDDMVLVIMSDINKAINLIEEKTNETK